MWIGFNQSNDVRSRCRNVRLCKRKTYLSQTHYHHPTSSCEKGISHGVQLFLYRHRRCLFGGPSQLSKNARSLDSVENLLSAHAWGSGKTHHGIGGRRYASSVIAPVMEVCDSICKNASRKANLLFGLKCGTSPNASEGARTRTLALCAVSKLRPRYAYRTPPQSLADLKS